MISSSHITRLSMHPLIFFIPMPSIHTCMVFLLQYPVSLSVSQWKSLFFSTSSPLSALPSAHSTPKAHRVSNPSWARDSRLFHSNPQECDPKTNTLCCSPRPPTLQKHRGHQHHRRNMINKNPCPINTSLISPTFPGDTGLTCGV